MSSALARIRKLLAHGRSGQLSRTDVYRGLHGLRSRFSATLSVRGEKALFVGYRLDFALYLLDEGLAVLVLLLVGEDLVLVAFR